MHRQNVLVCSADTPSSLLFLWQTHRLLYCSSGRHTVFSTVPLAGRPPSLQFLWQTDRLHYSSSGRHTVFSTVPLADTPSALLFLRRLCPVPHKYGRFVFQRQRKLDIFCNSSQLQRNLGDATVCVACTQYFNIIIYRSGAWSAGGLHA
jgi:hypothetical protein